MNKVEEMYLQALTEIKMIWSSNRESTLDTVNNLENLYANQDKMNEVEEMYVRTLTEKKKVWDLEHTSTLDIINNLRNLYKDQDNMKVVEDMYFCHFQSNKCFKLHRDSRFEHLDVFAIDAI